MNFIVESDSCYHLVLVIGDYKRLLGSQSFPDDIDSVLSTVLEALFC